MFPSSVLTRPRSALLCGSGLLAALAGTPAAAQEPLSTARTAAAVAPLRAPLRAVPTTSGDAPAESGVWAAGPDYKVSFHDGRVEFHPVLGPDAPRNLPVTWTTSAVLSGDAPVVEPGAVAHESFSDWRFERRTGVVTEAWNVRADGVEQTFVFAAPLGTGDLVVRGRLDSELEAAPLAPSRHAALEFRDGSGRAVVRYGEGYAIDATGRMLPLATAFDGSQVELRVPAAWLATAEWPVTIDPLLSAATIAAARARSPPRAWPSTRRACTDEAGLPVKARRFAYPSTAQVTLFGQGCGTGTPLIIDAPHAGHGSFRFGMDGLPGQTAALLLLGAASADVPLDGLGMTGCRLLVDAGGPLVVLPLAVSSLGAARPTLTLPSTLHADLVAQVAWFAPGANPAGIAAGRGFRVQVR